MVFIALLSILTTVEGIQFNIWSILILVGAAQGIFLSLFLLGRPENRQANRWLAALLAAISLHLAEYAADITGISFRYPALIAITYPLLFCFGPFYYLYCRGLLNSHTSTGLKTLLYFVLPVAVLVMMLPFYTMPAQDKVDVVLGTVNTGVIKIPTEQLVIMGVHIAQTMAYIFASFRLVRRREGELKQFLSDTVVMRKIAWLKAFNLYLSAYFLLYFVVVVLWSLQHAYSMEADYVLLLIGAGSIYVIGYMALSHPGILKDMPHLQPAAGVDKVEEQPETNTEKHAGLKDALVQYMETARPYLQSDLKISDLASALAVSSHQLSQLINQEFEVNFYDFVNRYRVEEAKKLLLTNQSYKILVIGYEVGFNSKATFNRVFKKLTNYTPSEYKEQFSQGS